MIERCLLFLVAFFVIYTPYLIFRSILIPVGHAVALLLVVYYFTLKNRPYVSSQTYILIAIGAAYFFLLSVKSYLEVGEYDTRYLRIWLDCMIVTICVAFARTYLTSINRFEMLQRTLFLLTLFNSLVVYLCFLSDSFRGIFYAIFGTNPKMFEYPIPRYSGFLYDGFSYASVLQAIILVLYFEIRCILRRSDVWGVLLFVVSLPMIILVGRAGLILIVLYILIRFLYSPSVFFFLFSWRSILVAIVVVGVGSFAVIDIDLINLMTHSLRFLEAFASMDLKQDSSLNEITSNHLYFPDSVAGIIFGQGYLSYFPSDLVKPDPGLTVLMFASGIIGYLIFIGVFILVCAPCLSRGGVYSLLALLLLLLKDRYIFYPIGHFVLFGVITYVSSFDRAALGFDSGRNRKISRELYC